MFGNKANPLVNPRVSDESIRTIAAELSTRLMPSIGSHFRNSIKCCPNCEHFQADLEKCGLNSKRPPATVIAFGCECFVNNDMPF